ncbi:glucose-1-phosphate thymidylyltransferase [Desulfurococcaceae archaeon MEX13E-LK6-19]|nr:glucose-1-phosphate thymidylyltransferase [Desulfurococcaceae archaeon MEX13E-LK6-19]
MKGVLLHGGFGTRLRPLTHTGPKQLIPIAGKPVSQWCLEDLRDSGVKEIAVILGELAPERVIEYYGDGSWLGVKLTYIYQGYPYGLAHAVYVAKDFVEEEPFVVYLGDNILVEGIREFVRRFDNSDADAMILLTQVPDPRKFGVAEFDENGRLKRLVEKPKKPPSNYALVGVYFFRPPHIFRAIESLKPSWRGELEITDAIQRLIDWGLRVDYAVVKGWWKDTGTPEDILEANRLLLDYKYHEHIVKGKLEENVRVEGRVYIEEGAIIKSGSVVRGPVYIGANTVIGPNTYIGPYTSIGKNCVISNVEIENSVIMDNVVIKDIRERIVNSLIGSGAKITCRAKRPHGLRFIAGENTIIEW